MVTFISGNHNCDHSIVCEEGMNVFWINILRTNANWAGSVQSLHNSLTQLHAFISQINILHPLKSMDTSSKQKIYKEPLALNDTLGQMDLIDIKNTPSKSSRISMLLKCTWIVHIAGHKNNLNKFKKTEILSSIISTHNSMKVESLTKITGKTIKM